VATAGRGACREGRGGHLAAMLPGPGGEASRPPIDLLGLGAIDRSNLQEFMVSMWG